MTPTKAVTLRLFPADVVSTVGLQLGTSEASVGGTIEDSVSEVGTRETPASILGTLENVVSMLGASEVSVTKMLPGVLIGAVVGMLPLAVDGWRLGEPKGAAVGVPIG